MWLENIKVKISIIIIFLVIFFQFIFSNFKVLSTPAQDFSVLYFSGVKILNSENPYQNKIASDFHTPPPSLIIFSLLSTLPINSSQYLWFVLSYIAFIIGSYSLFKSIETHDPNIKLNRLNIWLIYLSFVLVFFPFRYNLGSGEVNNFVFLCLSLGFYFSLRKQDIGLSLLMCLGIIFKITPLFFLLIFLLEKRFKPIFLTFILLIFFSIIAGLFFGFDIYKNYFEVLPRYSTLDVPVYYNQSLSAFLQRISSDHTLTRLINLGVLAISLLGFITLIKFKTQSFLAKLVIWNFGIFFTLIFSPFAWQHHFVITIYPLVTSFYLIYKLKLTKLFYMILGLVYILIGINIKSPDSIYILRPIILSHVLLGLLILVVVNVFIYRKVLSYLKDKD